MNLPMPLAMSFPALKCNACGCVCEWQDAIAYEIDGKLYGIRHVNCEVPDGD